MVEFDAPVIGFDEMELIDNFKIKNINKGSNAYKAGLRDNQIVTNYNINYKHPEEKISIYIKDKDQIKEISYFPETKKVKIPQYELVENS
jgi:hypothetical protein